jgi:hypothetical protein
MAEGGAKQSQGKMLGSSHAEVFNVMDLKERDKVVKVVKQEDVSLGMVDPSTGRYTKVWNYLQTSSYEIFIITS